MIVGRFEPCFPRDVLAVSSGNGSGPIFGSMANTNISSRPIRPSIPIWDQAIESKSKTNASPPVCGGMQVGTRCLPKRDMCLIAKRNSPDQPPHSESLRQRFSRSVCGIERHEVGADVRDSVQGAGITVWQASRFSPPASAYSVPLRHRREYGSLDVLTPVPRPKASTHPVARDRTWGPVRSLL